MTSSQRGLTLLELITTVAVLAILAGVAVPGFTVLRERMQASTTSHALTASLMMARMSAISSRHPVSMCPSADGAACDGAGDWSRGWIVFRDPARAGTPAAPSAVISRADPLDPGLHLAGSAGRQLVRYQPDGRSSGTNMSFRLCSEARSELLVSIIVNNAGRARVERPRRSASCSSS